jgi:hypothetical protein
MLRSEKKKKEMAMPIAMLLRSIVMQASESVLTTLGLDNGFGGAQIRMCVPDTLGSDAFRKHQVYSFFNGFITQPYNDNSLCLTATDEYTVQPIPSRRGQGWGIVMQPCGVLPNANNSWDLNANGAIVLTSLNLCIDIAGYGQASGTMAQLWPCTKVRPGTLPCQPPTAQCVPNAKCTCVANQRFEWTNTGNVRRSKEFHSFAAPFLIDLRHLHPIHRFSPRTRGSASTLALAAREAKSAT